MNPANKQEHKERIYATISKGNKLVQRLKYTLQGGKYYYFLLTVGSNKNDSSNLLLMHMLYNSIIDVSTGT